jgi:hypothetical protein
LGNCSGKGKRSEEFRNKMKGKTNGLGIKRKGHTAWNKGLKK